MKHYEIVMECYENGNPKTGRKIYQLKKMCDCGDCAIRRKLTSSGARNCIMISTMDKTKIEGMIEYLRNWVCSDGTIWQKTIYETW